MKVSAFTFIKNGQILGYPFLQSIQSILPIVDEFVINVVESEDNTLVLIQSIESEKIRIIKSKCNCTYECALSFNILGNWRYQPRLISSLFSSY